MTTTINNEHKKLNVPNLRFKEFQGEWEEHSLSELLDFKNGLNPKPDKFGNGIKFISVMDILNNAVITYDCIKASVDVTEKELSDFSVEKGDLLFQHSSETLEDISERSVSNLPSMILSICLTPSPMASMSIQLAARFFIPSGEQ